MIAPASVEILILGYGNPGRLDDGLGPALARAVSALQLPAVTVDANYQLTVEDAAEIAEYDVVVFADADVSGPEPFHVKRIEPGPARVGFSSHSVSPEDVLSLARQLFDAEPEAYVLGIRGYEFNEFGETLSDRARANLDRAVAYVADAVQSGTFAEVRSADTEPPDGTSTSDE